MYSATCGSFWSRWWESWAKGKWHVTQTGLACPSLWVKLVGEAGGQRGHGWAKVWMTSCGTFQPQTISRPHSELFLPVKWGRLPAAPSLGQSRPCEVAGKYSCSLAWGRIQWLSHTTSLPLAGPLSPPKPETQCAQLEQSRSTFVDPAVRVHSRMSLVPQLCLKCRQNLWFLCRGMFPSPPTILIPAEYPTIQLNSDTVGSLGDRTRSYRLKSQSYKTTPTSSANSMSRLSFVFWTGCKSEVLGPLPWGIAKAAHRTQRNILLTRPPIDYKRI